MSLVVTKPLVGHLHAKGGPPEFAGQLYDYVTAGDGVYVRARRPEFWAINRIAKCEVRGLAPLDESFELWLPRVPVALVRDMLAQAVTEGAEGLEVLFHLCFEEGLWTLHTPAQEQSHSSCRALDSGDGSTHQRAVIEVHSHHSMPARFSAVDDADEQGLRVYAVIGEVFRAPEVRVRVGVYGYWREISATEVFELPRGLHDCLYYKRLQ